MVAVCVRENHSMGIKCPPALRMKSTPADVLLAVFSGSLA